MLSISGLSEGHHRQALSELTDCCGILRAIVHGLLDVTGAAEGQAATWTWSTGIFLLSVKLDSSFFVHIACPTCSSGRSLGGSASSQFLGKFRVRETSLPVSVEDFFRYGLEAPKTQGLYSPPPKILFDVLHAVPDKVRGVGVVMFDGLRDIDDVEVGVVIKGTVFGKIGVDEFASVVHFAKHEEKLLV